MTRLHRNGPVTVVHWNPRSRARAGRIGRLVGHRPRVNNFGDLLGPMIVDRIVQRAGAATDAARSSARVLTVGSILGLARDGDVVWGSGVNGKSLDRPFTPTRLDVRAVRGPLTQAFLRQRGIAVPDVFGDPALLVGALWTREELAAADDPTEVLIVPNLHDHRALAGRPDVLDPCAPVHECLRRIAASSFVIGSSLHGVVVAEALGIGARSIVSPVEPPFKYEDYALGSGRPHRPATSVEHALELGPQPPPAFAADALLEAFPMELWAPEHELAPRA